MQLTTQTTDVIIFIDKSKRFISDKSGEIKKACLEKDRIVLNGNIINTMSISKILDIKSYYDEYPDNRPLTKNVFVSAPLELNRPKNDKVAMEGMIKGLKKYINSSKNKGTGIPELKLQKLENKLQTL